MTNILELLKNEKVKWKKIQDISKRIVSGGTPNRSNAMYYGGSIPWLRTQEVDFKEIHSTELYITEEGLANSSATLIAPNTIIVAMYGATAGKVALTKIPLTTNQACCNIEVNTELIKYRYVYHWLVNNYKVLKSMGQGSQSNINSTIIKNFPIPVPSLETQEKIVEILDKFTNYVMELQSELQSRTKQYTYYRDKLLSEEYLNKITQNKINNFSLKSVAEYSSKRISAEELDASNYVGVDNLLKDKYGREDSSYVPETGISIKYEKDDILIGNIRPYLRKIWYADRIGGTNGDVLAISVKNEDLIDSRYLYHVLADERFFEYNIKYSKGAKMPRGDKNKIMEYHFPIPPLHVQQHVVSILDDFDTLVNDIKEGLPKEIEQRQKQYEYWRSVLLIFK